MAATNAIGPAITGTTNVITNMPNGIGLNDAIELNLDILNDDKRGLNDRVKAAGNLVKWYAYIRRISIATEKTDPSRYKKQETKITQGLAKSISELSVNDIMWTEKGKAKIKEKIDLRARIFDAMTKMNVSIVADIQSKAKDLSSRLSRIEIYDGRYNKPFYISDKGPNYRIMPDDIKKDIARALRIVGRYDKMWGSEDRGWPSDGKVIRGLDRIQYLHNIVGGESGNAFGEMTRDALIEELKAYSGK